MTKEELYDLAATYGIPSYMHGGLARYVLDHVAPGDFLEAVICNDLYKALRHADDTNKELLHHYVKFFYNEAPGPCWGSREKYQAWLERSKMKEQNDRRNDDE